MSSTGLYPRTHFDRARVGAIGQAGGVLLTDTIRATGIDVALSQALARWQKSFATHNLREDHA